MSIVVVMTVVNEVEAVRRSVRWSWFLISVLRLMGFYFFRVFFSRGLKSVSVGHSFRYSFLSSDALAIKRTRKYVETNRM